MTYEEFYKPDGQYSKAEIIEWFWDGNCWEDDNGREYKQFTETISNPEIQSQELLGMLSGYVFEPTENPFSVKIATKDGIRGIAPAMAFRTSDNFTLIFF